jgi:hypothetical protein
MDEDMARRFHKRFAVEEELWRSDDHEGHLVIAGSFSIGRSGLPQLIEITLMPVTREWLPYEGSTIAAWSRRRWKSGVVS